MSQLDLIVVLAALATVVYAYIRGRTRSPRLPLPPGPKGFPIIGNLIDAPTSSEWKTYHKWSKELNTDILYLNIFGTNLIVLDTSEAAMDLLEKRSSIYSGRSRMPMAKELMGWDFLLGIMEYGDRWRKNRRIMHNSLHPKAATRLRPHTLKATHNLLNRFIDNPGDIMGNLRHMAGETIISIAYGLRVQPIDDPYIKIAEEALYPMLVATIPGTYLVDQVPILKYVPEWMPGAGFKKKAREWKKLARTMVEMPFAAAKRNIAEGVSTPSFTSISLQRMIDGTNDEAYCEEIIKTAAGTMYTAGSETTVSAIASCILGLLENPHVLKKAQQEIASVIKPGQLPYFDDEPFLPYITAIVKESLRWREVLPIAIPHTLSVDDEYKGYHIPAGSIIIPNAWAMLHNEDVYPEPFTFNPDRFMKDGKLDKSVRDPAHACWGFGRRICPGRYMAFSAVWIAIASIITVFDIQKEVDENGDAIELTHDYSSALVCIPKPFKCSIEPRSREAESLIRSVGNNGDD